MAAAKVQLPNVTLASVTSVNIEDTHDALLHCAGCIEFGAVRMLCSSLPAKTDGRVEYIRIAPIDFLGYSRFIIESLNSHIQTSHCLLIQSDGFIVDAARWRDEFLEYDYIGAPWPEYVGLAFGGRMRLDKNSVGNGGFSLRSKKLLEVTSRIRFDRLNFPLRSEDLVICHYFYDDMRAAGIQFALPELAAAFSIESPGIYGQSLDSAFGFHGKHWLEKARTKVGLQPKSNFSTDGRQVRKSRDRRWK